MAVQVALTRAINLWKRIPPKEYPNGAVVFCSEDLTEVLHPPTPLRRRIYDCGRHFNTSVIQDAIDTQLGNMYGLIVVDGSDAAFGKAQGLGLSTTSGPVITELGRLGAHIAGRTRRGGQSANRYARLRDEAELGYLRKVAERAAALFKDMHGLIIAGKADMKHKLIAELPEPLQKQVICTLDLSCEAGPEALRQTALRAATSATSVEASGLEQTLRLFFDLTMKESMCCYGEAQTVRALQLGAVEHLLLSADLDTSLASDDWSALAAMHGTHVVEIHPRSELGTQFCKSFGIGGCLRWPVEAELLEDDGEMGNDENVEEECAEQLVLPFSSQPKMPPFGSLETANSTERLAISAVIAADADDASISTADTAGADEGVQHRRQTLAWFEAELREVLGDPCAAEALTACVEVVLSDEVSSRDEVVEGVHAVTSEEGVPDALAEELLRRW